MTDGLVSYWTFDRQDIAGDTVKDVWGENDGKIVGAPKIVGGHVREALEFDGSDDYVNLTNLGDFGEQVGTSTFEAWVKTSFKKDWTTLFKVLDQGAIWRGQLMSTGVRKQVFRLLRTSFTIMSVRNRRRDATPSLLKLNSPCRMANGITSFSQLRMQANPRSASIWTVNHRRLSKVLYKNLDTFIPFVEPVYIGAANNRGNVERHFPGIIDEVRIYDRPLTADEVTRNFESKIGLSVQALPRSYLLSGLCS